MTLTIPAPMLIEQALPTCDAVRAEHLVVSGDAESAYAAVLRADFIRAWRDSPAVLRVVASEAVAT